MVGSIPTPCAISVDNPSKNSQYKNMKDPITLLLQFFGKEVNPKNSLLFNHMMETTNSNWHTRLFNNNNIGKYQYNIYGN